MKSKHGSSIPSAAKKRADEPMRGVCLLLDLGESLDQSRARGITLAEARRRLAKRLAVEGWDAKRIRRAIGATHRRGRPSGQGADSR